MDRLGGVIALPVTPFTNSGELDELSMRRLVDRCIDGGVSALIALGRVGEVTYMTMDERARVMDVVLDQTAGRVPIGFGCIDLTFDDGLTLARLARDAGADFMMSRSPIDGDIIKYYRRVAEVVPVMVYDLGVQRDMSIEDDIAPLIADTGNVVGVKISGLQEQVVKAKEILDVPVLCGHEAMLLVSYQLGADGVTSGFAMLSPDHEVALYELAREKRWDEARDLFYTTHLPLVNYLPGGPGMVGWSIVKNILAWEGIIDSPYVRPPSLPAGATRLAEARGLWEKIKASEG